VDERMSEYATTTISNYISETGVQTDSGKSDLKNNYEL